MKEVHRRYGKPKFFGGESGMDVVVELHGRRDLRAHRCAACATADACSPAARPAGFDPKEDIRYIWTFELNIVGSNGWLRRRPRGAARGWCAAASSSP